MKKQNLIFYPLDKFPHFKNARLLSYLSEGRNPGHRLGAVLHRGKRALSFGCNLFDKTHTLHINSPRRQFLHAEINALIKRRYYDDIASCEITVYRETYDGKPALAKPCKDCQKILQAFGIKKVYYSIPDEPYFAILKL